MAHAPSLSTAQTSPCVRCACRALHISYFPCYSQKGDIPTAVQSNTLYYCTVNMCSVVHEVYKHDLETLVLTVDCWRTRAPMSSSMRRFSSENFAMRVSHPRKTMACAVRRAQMRASLLLRTNTEHIYLYGAQVCGTASCQAERNQVASRQIYRRHRGLEDCS